jgi:hypothetical protein
MGIFGTPVSVTSFFMFLNNVSHTSSEQSYILHISFCLAPNLSFRIFPLFCIFFFYMTLLTWDAFCSTFGTPLFPHYIYFAKILETYTLCQTEYILCAHWLWGHKLVRHDKCLQLGWSCLWWEYKCVVWAVVTDAVTTFACTEERNESTCLCSSLGI